MPLYEYKCSDCKSKFEVLHKSTLSLEEVTCPKCDSTKNKKLFSSFSASISSGSDHLSGGCSDGSCGMSDSSEAGGCATGMCGLN